jgi:choline dehydrogenase-like flavoprotein
LAAAGAKNISCSRAVLNYPGHLLGTARMGRDPERSVVNEWGRCHNVKNLFIVDGSIWVTSGGVNPTRPSRHWRSTSPTASKSI